MGDVANNLAFQMTSMFLMVYMTDIVGLSAAAAGTIYAVTKVWAGVADLVAGNTVDKANTRWGGSCGAPPRSRSRWCCCSARRPG